MDNLTKEQRQKNMRNIRSSGTIPEKLIMRELRKRKIYFAKNVSKITGKPDIVFRRKRLIVFIDSDFWHGNPERFAKPKTNVDYWSNKIARNKERDVQVTKELENNGWKVIRFWESDIKKDLNHCVSLIIATLLER